MKRNVFVLIGLVILANVSFTSCEDLLSDDNKNSREDTEHYYRTVQDSLFFYRNGILQQANYYYYDSTGYQTRSLNLTYNDNGILIQKQENSYYTDGDKNISFTNNYGSKLDTRTVTESSGSGNDRSNSRKTYTYYLGKQILTNENISQKNIQRNIQYAIYNGQSTIVSMTETKITYYSPSNIQAEIESISFNRNCSYEDYVNRLIITSLGNKSWTKEIIRNNTQGQITERIALSSVDSITWNETRRYEYKYDSNGNTIEYLYKTNGSVYSKNLWTYNNNNQLLKEEYYVWSDSERNLILNASAHLTYSETGKLATIEINSVSNNINLTQTILPIIYTNTNSILTYSIGTMSVYSGSKCSITCDPNGFPASEILYRLDSSGRPEEFGRCTLIYDSNGTCLSYVAEILENNEWKEIRKNRLTLDSRGNTLSSYSYSYNFNDGYNTSFTDETESTQENRYDELGYISYSISLNKSHRHTIFHYNGSEQDNDTETKREVYYTTIKIR